LFFYSFLCRQVNDIFNRLPLITILFLANDIPKTWEKVLSAFEKGVSPRMQRTFPRLSRFHAPANKGREEKSFLQPAMLS
jgi:hypothetical protein